MRGMKTGESSGPPSATTFVRAWLAPSTVRRALAVAAVVGTVLIAINHGDLILRGGAPPVWKIVLTYFVPYAVSSWSSAATVADG